MGTRHKPPCDTKGFTNPLMLRKTLRNVGYTEIFFARKLQQTKHKGFLHFSFNKPYSYYLQSRGNIGGCKTTLLAD